MSEPPRSTLLARGLAAGWLVAAAGALCTPASAAAQIPGPDACAQEATSASYGGLRPGDGVVLQRHRHVYGHPNWDGRMARYLGRRATVTRLSGVDSRGCPGVRVSLDGGRWFWRVRDLVLLAARRVPLSGGRAPPPELPQACGRTDATVSFGPLRVGALVTLGRHRVVGGDDNWTPAMRDFVGVVARVVGLTGTDDEGCAVVEVDADGRQWLWRVRDMTLALGERDGYRASLAADHGRRVPPPPREPAPDDRVPQACGLTDAAARYSPVAVGARVVPTRHRAVSGDANWSDSMAPFVDAEATVTALVGVDEQGCPVVHLDVDSSEHFWRVRDLRLPEAGGAPGARPTSDLERAPPP